MKDESISVLTLLQKTRDYLNDGYSNYWKATLNPEGNLLTLKHTNPRNPEIEPWLVIDAIEDMEAGCTTLYLTASVMIGRVKLGGAMEAAHRMTAFFEDSMLADKCLKSNAQSDFINEQLDDVEFGCTQWLTSTHVYTAISVEIDLPFNWLLAGSGDSDPWYVLAHLMLSIFNAEYGTDKHHDLSDIELNYYYPRAVNLTAANLENAIHQHLADRGYTYGYSTLARRDNVIAERIKNGTSITVTIHTPEAGNVILEISHTEVLHEGFVTSPTYHAMMNKSVVEANAAFGTVALKPKYTSLKVDQPLTGDGSFQLDMIVNIPVGYEGDLSELPRPLQDIFMKLHTYDN